MVQPISDKFAMPYSSWDAVQKIIRAYNAASGYEKPTVNDIAKLAGIQRPMVSANNNFLRELGLLQAEQNKLTPLGVRLATGIEIGNDSMVTEALQESVRFSAGLSQLLNTLRARGTMGVEGFKGHLITVAQLTKKSPTINYLKTVIDYLEDAEVIQTDGDNVSYTGHSSGARAEEKPLDRIQPPPPPLAPQTEGMPIPLGVNRQATLKLPEDWTSRDLPRLIKMIQLALSEDTEGG
ncbi:MAG: hypothetical protein M3410_18720 [Acidobacteriota bacterium]|nr:hypothetical protein [Acidobacteriota bacterium]